MIALIIFSVWLVGAGVRNELLPNGYRLQNFFDLSSDIGTALPLIWPLEIIGRLGFMPGRLIVRALRGLR